MPAARYTLLLALILATALPSSADTPASSVDSLSASVSGNTITAEGVATIAGSADVVVGTDAQGDAATHSSFGIPSVPLTGLGMDMTSASIKQDPANDRLVFTLKIADPMDQIFTLPEVIAYHWLIKVTNGSSSIYYQLQAMRSGQYERTLPSAAPRFLVNSCSSLASGDPNCFELAGYVDGVMANGIVQWQVPVSLIGAFRGSTIVQSAPGQVRSIFSASGAAYFADHGDTIETLPYVVGPAVHIGIRKSNQDPELTKYQDLAALGPDGTFVGKIARPSTPGAYVLSARACNGDPSSCATREVPLQIA
jgi:hypothetical protein